MTYKSTSDAQDFHARVGSSSTKGYATGRVEVLPPHARPWEEIYIGLRAQYDDTLGRLNAATDELWDIENKLTVTMPRCDFEPLVRKRHNFIAQVTHYTKLLSELRKDAKSAAANSLGGCFMAAAERLIPAEQYAAILLGARELIDGMPSTEALKPPPERTSPFKGETESQRTSRRRLYQSVINPRNDANAIRREEIRQQKTTGYRACGSENRLVHKEF
jgi:hypothetical protein